MKINPHPFFFLLFLIAFSACQKAQKEASPPSRFTPSGWIDERVASSLERLSATEAGRLVQTAIEAHGGLQRWFTNGPVSFQFDYQPVNGSTRRNTFQTVDQWSARSVHELPNSEVRFGWDGEKAWIYPDTAELDVNARFWANTPFYFVALPFVLADPGTVHTLLDPIEMDGKTYDLVKTTYEVGTGDAPDDFYVIYIDRATKKLGALRYIVSYPGFFPNGGHSKEKIMKITGLEEIDGIWLPTGYRTFWWEEGVGKHVTNIDVFDVDFNPELEPSFFQMPDGAREQQNL